MILYEDKDIDNIANMIADYVGIERYDADVVGVYLFPYFDNVNCFDIITFMKNPDNKITSSIKVNNTLLTHYYFSVEELEKFEELVHGVLLYDPNNLLTETRKKFQEKGTFAASNAVELAPEFLLMLQEKISSKLKVADDENEDAKKFDLLVDYYSNLIETSSGAEIIDSIITCPHHRGFGYGSFIMADKKAHLSAIAEAIKSKSVAVNNSSLDCALQKKYTNN